MSDNSAYVGVDPIYQGYADVATKPFFSGDKDERKLEEAQQASSESAKVELNEYGLPKYDGTLGPDESAEESAPAPTLVEQVIDIVEAREAVKAQREADDKDAAAAASKAATTKASTAKTAAAKAADAKPADDTKTEAK